VPIKFFLSIEEMDEMKKNKESIKESQCPITSSIIGGLALPVILNLGLAALHDPATQRQLSTPD
jgi:hypothetical protein